ncbi:MAG: hypothetical protein RL272_1093 [Candidatus Parcubacteria bacterium]|jgi:signal transduction histidine kinase
MGKITRRNSAEGFTLSEFRRRLAFFVVIILLPLYVLAVFNIYNGYQQAVNDETSNGLRIVRTIAAEQQRATEAVEPLLTILSRLPEVRMVDAAGCTPIFARLLESNPPYLNIGAVTPDGSVFCSAVVPQGPVNVSDQVWFQQTMSTAAFSAGDYVRGAVTKKPTINYGFPFYAADGRVGGAVYASLDIERLNLLAQDIRLPPDSTFTVFDRDGTVVARYPNPEDWVGTKAKDSEVYKALFSGPLKEGVFEARGLDGVRRMYAFSPLDRRAKSSPLVAIGFSRDVLFRSVVKATALNIAGLALITVVVLLLAWFAGNELVVSRVQGLQELNRLKSEFVALASHQLRTPLTSIRWLSELLIAETAGPLNDEQRGMVGEVKASVADLLSLVNELLGVGKIDMAKIRVNKTAVDMEALLREVVASVAPLAARKGLRIELEAGKAGRQAETDPMLVRQVVTNLLSNAIAYSRPEGRIVCRLDSAGKDVGVSVIDSGIGIPAAEQSRIFGRFYRASNVQKTHSNGTGLGLFISKSLVELLGGSIGFTSVEDEGSTFWFTVPKKDKSAR